MDKACKVCGKQVPHEAGFSVTVANVGVQFCHYRCIQDPNYLPYGAFRQWSIWQIAELRAEINSLRQSYLDTVAAHFPGDFIPGGDIISGTRFGLDRSPPVDRKWEGLR